MLGKCWAQIIRGVYVAKDIGCTDISNFIIFGVGGFSIHLLTYGAYFDMFVERLFPCTVYCSYQFLFENGGTIAFSYL